MGTGSATILRRRAVECRDGWRFHDQPVGGIGMRVVLSLCVVVAAALALSGVPAFAASPSRCQSYADDAAKAANQVRQLKCGFNLKDDRWASSDASLHKRWCLTASDDDVNEEQNERDADLNRCKVCRSYAKAAVDANRLNIKYHCGLSGDRWGSNEDAHFSWCMANASETHYVDGQDVKVNILDYEVDQRADALSECEDENRAKIDFCNRYVDQTRADVKYVRNNCDDDLYFESVQPGDPRYSSDDDRRFEWCFDLRTGTPQGDSGYQMRGKDPVQYLHELATACQRRARARAVLHSAPTRPRLNGGQGFTDNAKSGGAGNSLIDRVKKTTTNTPGGGSSGVDRAKGGTSKLLAPGLLEGDGGVSQSGPAATGRPAGGPGVSAPSILTPRGGGTSGGGLH